MHEAKKSTLIKVSNKKDMANTMHASICTKAKVDII